MRKYSLEPEIYNFRTLNLLIESLNTSEAKDLQKQPIHIKIDTGMHRLGFMPEDIDELISIIKSNHNIHIQSVFTHLACSEDSIQDDFTHKQIELLQQICERFRQEFTEPFWIHALNSSGISRFADARFDMVRLGIGLYGISFSEEEQMQLQNVSSLKTTISQIKRVQKGETVGYGRKWKAEKDSDIAIVPIGYADGLSRNLGNGKGFLYVNGHKADIIGNVCMDMCMIDISGIAAKEGDQVLVYHDAASIKELSDRLNTIPYEILTSVSGRVKRVYYYE
jgi:Alr-MurF fusion protein